MPADLAGEQARDGALAAAHEAGEAEESQAAVVAGRRHRVQERITRRITRQLRLRMLIVPLIEVSSTFAWPSLNVPNRLFE